MNIKNQVECNEILQFRGLQATDPVALRFPIRVHCRSAGVAPAAPLTILSPPQLGQLRMQLDAHVRCGIIVFQ